jgi:hypothetical protein
LPGRAAGSIPGSSTKKVLVRGLNALDAAITSRLRRIHYLAKSLDCNLKGGVAEMIRCPILVCDAQDDLFFKGQPLQLYDHLTCSKTLIRFFTAERRGLPLRSRRQPPGFRPHVRLAGRDLAVTGWRRLPTPAGDHYRPRFERRTIMPCDPTSGICKRIDLESLSDDIARLVRQLGEEVEGKVQGDDLRKIKNKLEKIIEG